MEGKPKYTPMANFFRASTERFWYLDHLEYLVEVLKFKDEPAAWLAHEGLKQRRANAGIK